MTAEKDIHHILSAFIPFGSEKILENYWIENKTALTTLKTINKELYENLIEQFKVRRKEIQDNKIRVMKVERSSQKIKPMSSPHYEFYQESKFSNGKQMIKSISCTEKNLHTVERRIESLARNNTQWKLYLNGVLIRKSQPKSPESL
jgi:hypothetical protein